MNEYLRSTKRTTTVSPDIHDDEYYEDYTTTTRSRRRRTTTVSPIYYDDDYESPTPPPQVQKNATTQNNTQTIKVTTQNQNQTSTIDQDTSSKQEIMDPDQWSPYEEQPVSPDYDYENDTMLIAKNGNKYSAELDSFATSEFVKVKNLLDELNELGVKSYSSDSKVSDGESYFLGFLKMECVLRSRVLLAHSWRIEQR
jgi:hypothetical protein